MAGMETEEVWVSFHSVGDNTTRMVVWEPTNDGFVKFLVHDIHEVEDKRILLRKLAEMIGIEQKVEFRNRKKEA